MKAKSIKGNSPEEIQTALQQSMADGFKPTLAVVFLSVKQNRDAVCSMLSKEGIAIFGATTGGEFIDGEIGAGSIAILLLDVDQAYFKILCEDISERDTRTVAKEMGEMALQSFKKPAFLVSFSNPFSTEGEMIMRGIEDAAGKDTTIWGGGAGDDFMMKETFVFTNEKSCNKGIVLLVFDGDKIDLKGRATCGWKPQGTIRTVTKSEGWWIHTIDDQPALDLVVKYMGITLTRKEAIDPVVAEIGNYPLQLQREVGDPVIRSFMFFNWDDRSIMINGGVEQGSKIRLSVPADFDVIDKVIKESEQVMATELPQCDALIMFSCVGRLAALGPLIGTEIDGVRNTFNVPMVGFFTYGEFGRATNGNHEFHNLTCCWVALKEK